MESCPWRKGDLTAGKLNIKRCARGAVFTSDLYVKTNAHIENSNINNDHGQLPVEVICNQIEQRTPNMIFTDSLPPDEEAFASKACGKIYLIQN